MNDLWTFGGLPFLWLRQTGDGNMALLPTWKREPVLAVRPFLGEAGRVQVEQTGYGPWQLTGPILVRPEHVEALTALSGHAATLSDGVLSWQAVASFGLDYVIGDTGAMGLATFVRLL